MAADIRQLLSEALRPVSEHYARLVADPLTEVEVYRTEFLSHYRIYRVEHFNPHRPVLFYVGFAPGEAAYLLTGAPDNYVRLARADGVAIDSPEIAGFYTVAYLEVTRDMSELFYLVHSVEDVEFRPHLTPAEAEVRTAVLQKYRSVLTPPTAVPTDGQYEVTAYAVHDQRLERHVLTVGRNGEISDDVTILEEELPLVYGL